MKELAENGEPLTRLDRGKQILSYAVTVIFIFSASSASEFFESYVSFYVFYYFWFLLFLITLQFLKKKKREPFNFQEFFKFAGFLFLFFLVLHNISSFWTALQKEITVGGNSSTMLVFVASLPLLFGLGFYCIEKHSKP